jgi:DNA invertase Pin-like site-specific DNA recombinase
MTNIIALPPTVSIGDEKTETSAYASASGAVDHRGSERRAVSGGQAPAGTGTSQDRPTDRPSDRSRGLYKEPKSPAPEWVMQTIRVLLYGRHSSDLQNPTSSGDQLALGRQRCAQEPDWKIVGEYRDEAISGASLIQRPGIQAVIEAALNGEFDVLLVEALDRLSRDQADIAYLYKQFQFAGIKIISLTEGEITELHIGLKGTMNALFLKDLAIKVRRGVQRKIEEHGNKSGGGLSYGYDVVPHYDEKGELIRGDRKKNTVQAEIVNRVLREYADGISPWLSAKKLNAEAETDKSKLSPTGGKWTASSIRGHPKRGTGLINNELYIGKLVWNKTHKVKNPQTGKYVIRQNPPEKWIVKEVPELRIVSDELWEAVKARQAQLRTRFANVIAGVQAHHASRNAAVNRALNSTRRPGTHFSGLLECGHCGSPYVIVGRDAYGCSGHENSGTCNNRRTISRKELQARVIGGLRGPVLDPRLLEGAINLYTDEVDRLNREWSSSYDNRQKTLLEIQRKIKNLTAAILDGGYTRSLITHQQELEAQEEELKKELASTPQPVLIRPDLAEAFRTKVERLADALQTPDESDELFSLIRSLIDHITITPDLAARRGKIAVILHGDLARILGMSASVESVEGLHRLRHSLMLAI